MISAGAGRSLRDFLFPGGASCRVGPSCRADLRCHEERDCRGHARCHEARCFHVLFHCHEGRRFRVGCCRGVGLRCDARCNRVAAHGLHPACHRGRRAFPAGAWNDHCGHCLPGAARSDRYVHCLADGARSDLDDHTILDRHGPERPWGRGIHRAARWRQHWAVHDFQKPGTRDCGQRLVHGRAACGSAQNDVRETIFPGRAWDEHRFRRGRRCS